MAGTFGDFYKSLQLTAQQFNRNEMRRACLMAWDARGLNPPDGELLKEILTVLRWAELSLTHFQDETGCCYKSCDSCKQLEKDPELRAIQDKVKDVSDPINALIKKLSS